MALVALDAGAVTELATLVVVDSTFGYKAAFLLLRKPRFMVDVKSVSRQRKGDEKILRRMRYRCDKCR